MGATFEIHVTASPRADPLSDAENGMSDSSAEPSDPSPFVFVTQKRPNGFELGLPPVSPVHEGITPLSSVPELSLSQSTRSPQDHELTEVHAIVQKLPPPKPRIGRWIRFTLWFNTYRKFFTLVTLLNLTGIILADRKRFKYAENHMGALVLGNLLCAILFRNELFMRFLYSVFIYGLRGVSVPSSPLTAAN